MPWSAQKRAMASGASRQSFTVNSFRGCRGPAGRATAHAGCAARSRPWPARRHAVSIVRALREQRCDRAVTRRRPGRDCRARADRCAARTAYAWGVQGVGRGIVPVCGKAGILSRALGPRGRLPGSDVKLRADVTSRSGAMHAGGGIWSNHETRSRRSRIDGPDLGQCNRNEDHRKMTDAMGNLMDLRPSFLKGRSSSGTTSRNVLQALWQAAGMPDEALAHVADRRRSRPAFVLRRRAGGANQWPPPGRRRSGICAAARQQVSVDMLHAAQECRSYFPHQRRHAGSPRPHHGRVSLRRWRLGAHPRQLPPPRRRAGPALPAGRGTPAPPSSGRWRAGPPSTSNRPPPTPAWWSPPCAASMNGIIIRRGRPPRSRCSRWKSARPIRVPAAWPGSRPLTDIRVLD